MPSTLSVTAFLTFVRDPDEFFRRYVRRVPSPPSSGREAGNRSCTGESSYMPVESRPSATRGKTSRSRTTSTRPSARWREPVSAEQMWENFQHSRFAQMTPLMVEQPFTLYIGEGISIQGRIDAVFEREDGVWEVIDYKSGKSDPDPLQLAIYSRAIEEIWGRRTAPSWLLLRTGEEQPAPPVDDLSGVLQRSATALKELG